MVDISTLGIIVSVPKKLGVENVSPRAFRRRIIVRDWHRLGCRAIELGKNRLRGVIYTDVYGEYILSRSNSAEEKKEHTASVHMLGSVRCDGVLCEGSYTLPTRAVPHEYQICLPVATFSADFPQKKES